MNALKNEFLTIAQVGEYLNISQSGAYALVHRKDFPSSRFGGSLRVPRDAFMAWIERHTHMPAGLSV